jgi:hypothetical protein
MLVALALFGSLGGVVTRALLLQHKATRTALDRAAVQQTLDQASVWLTSELSELGRDASGSDLRRIAPESLSYRAVRSTGFACLVAAGQVHMLESRLAAWRQPQPVRDSLLLFVGSDSVLGGEGRWVALPISGVSRSNCGGAPSLRLSTVFDTTRIPPSGPAVLLPARTFEVMQIRFYQSGSAWWLGARSESAAEAIQPIAGPLGPSGLRFLYRDSTLLPVSDPAATVSLELRLAAGSTPEDSVYLPLFPRNLP